MNATGFPPRRTFGWLLRREFWENRGGFLWAPALTGAITVLLFALLALAGSAWTRDAMRSGNVVIDGQPLRMGEHLDRIGEGVLTTGVVLTGAVLGFVVFFYALGALYDDRRDRSVLFWKSLPVSDAQMVLSKATWALVLAPLLAAAVGLLIGVALWSIALAAIAFAGPTDALQALAGANPLHVAGAVAAALPVYALWALPTVGWLMFCSAWARSKPFLMAVLVPVVACLAVGLAQALPGLALPTEKAWYVLFYRGLLSVFPGSWQAAAAEQVSRGPDGIRLSIDLTGSWPVLATAELWIGAAIGAALIAASIPLRRYREASD